MSSDYGVGRSDVIARILNAKHDEAAIRNLAAENPEQQRQLPALQALAAQKIQLVTPGDWRPSVRLPPSYGRTPHA
jgi:hypothetical protein